MSDQRADSLLTFLLGAAVGAGVALLLAPQSGEETRKQIADKTRRIGDDLDHKMHDVKEGVKAHKGELQKALVAGKDAFDRARHAEDPAPTNTAM